MGSTDTKKMSWQIILVGVWLVFTFSLAGWWLVFGLRQLDHLKVATSEGQLQPLKDDIVRQHQMILWEGGILLLSLLAGGGALFYYVRKERRQSQSLREFFATFSHELKTSLASVRLQAESLQEDLGTETSPLLQRLLSDTVRLQIQLENSLFLANVKSRRLFVEPLNVREIVHGFHFHWPDTEIMVSGDGIVSGDARALESVLKNIVQNSIVHGAATKVEIKVSSVEAGTIVLEVIDNGRGFSGDLQKLGKLFWRHTTTSGSGLGLYLVTELITQMKGRVEFCPESNFSVQLQLPGELQ